MSQKPVTTDEAGEPSTSDEYCTPPAFFAACDALYGPFDVDVASTDENRLCRQWFTRYENALTVPTWALFSGTRRAWCNPPYSKPNLGDFTARARREVLHRHLELVTCLIPLSSSAHWWHDNVEAPEGRILATTTEAAHFLGARTLVQSERLDVELLKVRGRLTFEGPGAESSARFHSVLVTFAQPGLLRPLVRPNRRGPLPSLTPEDVSRVDRLVAEGHSQSNACRLAGVNRRTWYRHKEKHHV
jgi:phage N-6-adenine-methyltransferase